MKKRKKIIIALTFIGIFLFVLVFPFISKAAIGIDDAIFVVLGWILALILSILQLFLYMAGVILDLVLGHALSVQNADIVTDGWALSRDVANMFFIIILLFIAFGTIFRLEAYQYKALLPKMILGILLVNFSRTIATIFIEFSNLLTAAFLNFDPGKTSSSALLALMGANNVFQIPEQMGINIWVTHDFTMVMSLAGIVFLIGILVVAIAGFAGMLVIRTIALLVLIVFSPVAFALGILPATSKVFEEWWENFIKYVLYTPLAAFALYLAMKIGSQMNDKKFIAIGEGMQGDYSVAVKSAAGQTVTGFGFAQSAEGFYGFCLVVGLLLFSIMMIQKVGGVMAGFAIGLAKGGMFWAGKGIGKRVDRGLAKFGKGMPSQILKGAGRYIGNRFKPGAGESFAKGFDKVAGFIGKGTKYLSPGVVKKAWQMRQEEMDHRAYNESVGGVRDSMNKVLFDEDKTNYKSIAQMGEVDRRKKMFREANPSGEYPYYVAEATRAAKDGRKEDFAALLELLEEHKNGNELAQRVPLLDDWAQSQNKFYSGDFLSKYAGVKDGKEGVYNPEAMRDMARTVLGDDMAKLMAGRLGAVGMETGNWSTWVGAIDTDMQTGKLKWRKSAKFDEATNTWTDREGSQQEEAAGQLAKQGEGGLNRSFRATAADLKYVVEIDPVTKTKTAKEIHDHASEMIRIYFEDHGAPQEADDRVGRFLGPLSQDTVGDVADQIERHIDNAVSAGLKGDKREAVGRNWLRNCKEAKKVRLLP